MIDFEFSIRPECPAHVHGDIELFYVMEGKCAFLMDERKYLLKKEDFLVVNADISHSYKAEESFLAASLRISYAQLSQMMHRDDIFFWCNTVVDSNEAYGELRGILKRVTGEQFRTSGRDEIYLNSLYYELLHVLTSDFLLNKDGPEQADRRRQPDERKREIEAYVRANFDKKITLEDMANSLFLSYAYLSKYIKKQFGTGFSEYVNSVRLSRAVSMLLHSDLSVARIAVDTGFSSSAALNKAFKDKYGMPPTDYRRRWIKQSAQPGNTPEEEKSIREQLAQHFAVNGVEDKDRSRAERVTLEHPQQKAPISRNWCRMINVGTAADLLMSDMQRHILALRDEFHFEYVRFWDLYSPEMHMGRFDGTDDYNFDKLDRGLDFLIQNGLKPYIELGWKPKILVVNRDKMLSREQEKPELSEAEMERLFRRLITHLLNRYSSEQVETWYFELWNAEPEEVLLQVDLARSLMPPLRYLGKFQIIARVMREYLPNIRLGGGGFSLRYGEDLFRSLLLDWKKMEQQPDFISIYAYPYTQENLDKGRGQTRSADFLRENLVKVRQIMAETEFPTRELHVSEWSFSASSRNVLNDHCMKGAYLVKNMIDCIDLADILGYWVGSDLYAADYDTKALLNGGGGLLTKDGISKPAFFAFQFMNDLGRYARQRGENYIISDNGSGNWRIVCHNLKSLSYQYSLYLEDEVLIEQQDSLFTDLKKKRLHFELPGKRDGQYILLISSVNGRQGSVQDEWVAMYKPGELSADNIRYLNRITVPGLVLQSKTAENGVIAFDVELEPNEIAFIHVRYRYS